MADVPMRSAVALALFAMAFAAGCSSGKSKKKKKKEKKAKRLPPESVDLPEPPPASEFEIPLKNSDGTFRVRGLIAHQAKHLNEKVTVKGVLTYISPECDPAKAQDAGEECPEPYLAFRDSEDADDRLLGVGIKREFIEEAELEEGETYEFKGSYLKQSHGFVATERGLLLLDKVGEHDVLEEEEEE